MSEKSRFAVYAFRKYARYGYDNMNLDIFMMCESAMGVSKTKKEAAMMVAVYQTLQALELSGKRETADALRAVYFTLPSRPIKKNEISDRIRRFARLGYMDERTAYRHVKTARELFEGFYKDSIKNIK